MPRRSCHYTANYPATVAEVLDASMKFKRGAVPALRAFAAEKPYRKDAAALVPLVERLVDDLSEVYGMPTPRVLCQWSAGASGASSYNPQTNTLTLRGRFSVVTLLHEFAHACGADEREAVRWSVNLFARVFPRSFARCEQVGHMLVRPGRA